MSKRTNKIYNVAVAIYANMAVEAESPQEAMKLAEKYKDEYLTDEDFDSEIEVESCDSYPSKIDGLFLEEYEYVFTADGVLTAAKYEEQLEEQELEKE